MFKKLMLIIVGLTSINILSGQTSFTNTSPIIINDNAPANPYSSDIIVAGLTGTISDISVTINGLTHGWVADIGILLQSPSGVSYLLQGLAADGSGINNVVYTFSDAGASQLPQFSAWTAGTYKPANYLFDLWAAPVPPAPPGVGTYFIPGPFGVPSVPTSTFASVYNGSAPNGTWKLFVQDFADADNGFISNGWSLNITTEVPLSLNDIHFNATTKNNEAILNWNSDKNNFSSYQMEHSANGIDFSAIEFVNSNANNSYLVKHLMNINSINFYRIKCIDTNSNSIYSEILKLINISQKETTVNPTNFKDHLNVAFSFEGVKTIFLYNYLGQIVTTYKTDLPFISLPINQFNLNTGLYFLHVNSEDYNRIFRVVKVNN
jgi:subtilisin-like proprotein convertase family protein